MNKFNIFLIGVIICFSACDQKEYALPTAKNELQNDVIKRKLGPNIAGDSIDFAYAIAIPASIGNITSAQVEASIAGATTTYIDPKSYYTNTSGVDVGITVAAASVNNANITSIQLNKDTNAVTFRYYYVIPPEAKGKEVTFKFSATGSNGQTVSYNMGPYKISNMDVVRRLTVSDGNMMYVSVADMSIYNSTTASANAAKVDLIYLHRSYTTGAFNHALVAPTGTTYLPGITLPSGVSNDTRLNEIFGLQDRNLSYLQYGIYVDDVDLQQYDFSPAKTTNYAIDLRAESGVWVETADKKYRAYIFVNAINNNAKTMVISMKRLQMN